VVRSWNDSARVVLPSQGRIEESRTILDTIAAIQQPAVGRDRAIVDAVLAGDRDAFRQLVDREAASVVRACHRVLGDLHDAEDAAQEAFVMAYRSLASWRGDGPFGAWLTRIAVRIAVRQAGRRKTIAWLDMERVADGSSDDPTSASVASASMAAAGRTDPSLLAARSERAADIRTAVAALPEPYREVVVLRFFAELSLEEIAEQVDRPLGTVKTHLHRGLLRLRSGVAPELGE
jgi:RNA polymerase sigma-70 factor, ECF subfamily